MKEKIEPLQLFVLVICQSLLLFVGGLLLGFHHRVMFVSISLISLLHQGLIIMCNPAFAKVLRDLVNFLSYDKDALLLFSNSGTNFSCLAFEACISDVVNSIEFEKRLVFISCANS